MTVFRIALFWALISLAWCAFVIVFAGRLMAHQKIASDAWIDRSFNAQGQRCCDAGKDCHSLEANEVEQTQGGVVRRYDGRRLFVPGREIMASEDGKWWVCYWSGRVRCVFAPYSGS